MIHYSLFLFYFLKDFIYLFLDSEGEREREKHQCVVASCLPPTRDLASNPDMCPEGELNWRPFGSQSGAQSTEAHQPGLGKLFFIWPGLYHSYYLPLYHPSFKL